MKGRNPRVHLENLRGKTGKAGIELVLANLTVTAAVHPVPWIHNYASDFLKAVTLQDRSRNRELARSPPISEPPDFPPCPLRR